MTTPDDTSEPAGAESTPRFAFLTPGGVVGSADDLPPGMREALLEQLDSFDLPDEIHAMIAAELSASGEIGVDSESLGIAATNEHREQLWDLLDRAFPEAPHLWNAAQALLDVSALNPSEIADTARLRSLETARLHLERHAALISPPMSPAEQMVASFVRRMDGL